jgi:manganese transport protein
VIEPRHHAATIDTATLPAAQPPQRSRLVFLGAGALVAAATWTQATGPRPLPVGPSTAGLLIVIALSSLVAMLLQWIAARVAW